MHSIKILYFFILSICIFGTSSSLTAQEDTVYFNKLWVECDKVDASYYRLFEIQDSVIQVDHFSMNHNLESSGLVKNTPGINQKLELIADLGEYLIGDWLNYNRRGKLTTKVNHTPFDSKFGIDSSKFNLLDSLDTINQNLNDLVFLISYFKHRTHYGSLLEEEKFHGTWIVTTLKTGRIVKQSHNYNNKINGWYIHYYKSGVIRKKSNYKDDVLQGTTRKYNRKGELVLEKIYEDGILKETWKYQKPKKKPN